MENGTELRAMQVAAGIVEGQAEVAASVAATPENQVSAETVVEHQPAAEVTIPASEEITPASEPTVPSEPYNYWLDLDQKTEGLVKDEESLTTLLTRAKEYDALVAEKASLFKPANDYIAKLNEMTLAGANPDQIKAFVTLNGYGDLSTLTPIELKVTKMVLTEGYSEEIARKIVNREFDLNQFDEEIPSQKDEADIMREKLRISSKADLEALNEYKKELSTVNNPEKANAEQARLQNIADLSAYNKTLEKETPNLIKHFPQKMDYTFKIGEEEVAYEDSIDKQFLEQELAVHVKEYFKDSMDPINSETLTEAYGFAYGEYLKAHDAKRLERAMQKGYNNGYEKAVNVYENRSGLPRAPQNQVVITNESGLTEFTNKQLLGR